MVSQPRVLLKSGNTFKVGGNRKVLPALPSTSRETGWRPLYYVKAPKRLQGCFHQRHVHRPYSVEDTEHWGLPYVITWTGAPKMGFFYCTQTGSFLWQKWKSTNVSSCGLLEELAGVGELDSFPRGCPAKGTLKGRELRKAMYVKARTEDALPTLRNLDRTRKCPVSTENQS